MSLILSSCARVNFATSPQEVGTLGSTTTIPGGVTTTTQVGGTTSTTIQGTTTTVTVPPTTTTVTVPPTTTTVSTTTMPPTTTTLPPTTTTVPGYVTRTKTVTVTPTMTSVDVLLVVDDSSSMAQDNAKLAMRMANFVSGLQAANLDWQMCVTTTDVGYYGGRPLVWSGASSHVLTKNSGNVNAIFQQTIYDIGSGFSNDEQGVKASTLSVLGNATTGCYRPQAALAVILISDEDERSVGGVYNLSSAQYQPLTSQNYPANYVNTVASTFNSGGFVKKLAFNSIVVTDSNCENAQDAQGTSSFIGRKYIEASNMTAGGIASICQSDYSTSLNLFRISIQNTVSSVNLDCNPLQTPTTNLPGGYTFTMTGNKMVFNPALQEGLTVTITYRCPL